MRKGTTCLLVLLFAAMVVAEEEQDDDFKDDDKREQFCRAIRKPMFDAGGRLSEARKALVVFEHTAEREQLVAALTEIQAGQAMLVEATQTIEAALGRPLYRFKITDARWKDRWVVKKVLQQQRMGRVVRVPKKVKSGGWMTITGKVVLDQTIKPVRAARLDIRIRSMEGFKRVFHWDEKRPVEAGATSRVSLQIGVHEEEMAGFWLRTAKESEIEAEVQPQVSWVRYGDATERHWR